MIEPEVQWSTGTSEAKTVTHRGPRRPPLVAPQQQLSPQTKALLNDENHKKVGEETNKTNRIPKQNVHWLVIASLLHNQKVLVRTNECRKEGNR